MRAGSMRHRIILQRPSAQSARDAHGERETVWTDVATVYARIRPLSSTESNAAAQRQSSVTHAVELRYSSLVSSIDASWRVKYGARILVIDGLIDEDERKRQLTLFCVEGLRNE